jgi:acetyltransferase
MFVRNLDKLFKPRAVALAGATPRHGSLAAVLARNLRRGSFGGPLMLVNPHQRSIGGMPVYSDIASLPEIPDLAVIATQPETAPGGYRRARRSGHAQGATTSGRRIGAHPPKLKERVSGGGL